MKKLTGFALLAFALVTLSACNNNEDMVEKQQEEIESLQAEVAELVKTNTSHLATIESQQALLDAAESDFSFLSELSIEEHKAYDQFLETKNTNHLTNFTPKKILLLYFHSAVIDDIETLYALTYDDGTLPEDVDTFREQYYTGELQRQNSQTIMHYRYYDSVAVREENRSDEEVGVEMSVSLGTTTHVIVFGLKKDADIWKMDVLHLADAM